MKTFTKILTATIVFLFFSGTYRRRFAILFLAGSMTKVEWQGIGSLANLVCIYQVAMILIGIPDWLRLRRFEQKINQVNECGLPPDVKAEVKKALIEQHHEEQKGPSLWTRFKEYMDKPVKGDW